jgi:hypothetical protein
VPRVDREDREQVWPAMQSLTDCPHWSRVSRWSVSQDMAVSQDGRSPVRAFSHRFREPRAVMAVRYWGRVPTRRLPFKARPL